MQIKEPWMRAALITTAFLNVAGAVLFAPPFPFRAALTGLPFAPPFYLWILSLWVGGFGVVYGWVGATARADRAFIAIGAFGKLSFAVLLFGFAATGALPLRASLTGIPDFCLGALFTYWLWRTRRKNADETA